MQSEKSQDQQERYMNNIRTSNMIFKILLYVAALIGLSFVALYLFFPEEQIDLEINGRELSIANSELTNVQVYLSNFVFSLEILIFVIGLIPLMKMSQNFSRKVIFDQKNIYYVKLFAIALLVSGFFSAMENFLVSHYLQLCGVTPDAAPFPVVEIFYKTDYFIIAIFILLICQVLRSAVSISEEAELTV